MTVIDLVGAFGPPRTISAVLFGISALLFFQLFQYHKISELADDRPRGDHVLGREDVYETLSTAVSLAREHICATHFAEPPPTAAYDEALAETLKRWPALTYATVIGVTHGDVESAERVRDQRLTAFDRAGVDRSRATIKFLNARWMLDLLIVDEKHLVIGCPAYEHDKALRAAIVFPDCPSIASQMSHWYEQYLLRNAKDSINEALTN